MDLRDKVGISRRFTETLLRFRLPLVVFFGLLFFMHTQNMGAFFSDAASSSSAVLTDQAGIYSSFSALSTAYGVSALILFALPFVYLIARFVLISKATTLVQVVALPLFFLVALAYERVEDVLFLGGALLLGGSSILMVIAPQLWIRSLFPALVTYIFWCALHLETAALMQEGLASQSVVVLWYVFSALMFGELSLCISQVTKEIEGGKAKLAAIASHFEIINQGLLKITALLLLVSIVAMVIEPALFNVLAVGAVAYLVYVVLLVIVTPVLFSFVPYQKRIKK